MQCCLSSCSEVGDEGRGGGERESREGGTRRGLSDRTGIEGSGGLCGCGRCAVAGDIGLGDGWCSGFDGEEFLCGVDFWE